jgi:glycosyltransferase involved in cell wall biosynthesis
LKILYLITGLLHGGAEVQLVELSKRMLSRGHRVAVVSVLPEGGYVEEVRGNGIPVSSLDIRLGSLDPRALTRLAGHIWRLAPDVVHSLLVHSNLLARMVRPIAPVRVQVSTALSIDEGRKSPFASKLRELGYRLTDPLSDATTQVSTASAARYVAVGAVPSSKMRTITCGVDSKAFVILDEAEKADGRMQLKKESGFRWLSVGRLVPVKDHVTAVRGFSRALGEENAAELVIRGAGPTENEVRLAAVECGVEGQVRILAERCDIPRLMNESDGFVISSTVEGMPTVALEAAACGLPIVATDVGGNREVVLDGINGFVVPPKDPEALAAAMIKVMKMSPEERRAMGLAGRMLVEQKYDFDIVAAQYEALYNELLAKKGIEV